MQGCLKDKPPWYRAENDEESLLPAQKWEENAKCPIRRRRVWFQIGRVSTQAGARRPPQTESINSNNCNKFTSGCLSQHPLLSHISSSLSPFFLTSNTSSIHQALHPSIIKLALHPSFCGSSKQPGWMSSFCSLASFLYLPFCPYSSSFLCVWVCVRVCEFLLENEDRNKHLTCKVRTF